MGVVDMKKTRLKVALGKALETMETMARRVSDPKLRDELLTKAAKTRAKINALEVAA